MPPDEDAFPVLPDPRFSIAPILLTPGQSEDLRSWTAETTLWVPKHRGLFTKEINILRERHRKEQQERLSFPTLWDHLLE